MMLNIYNYHHFTKITFQARHNNAINSRHLNTYCSQGKKICAKAGGKENVISFTRTIYHKDHHSFRVLMSKTVLQYFNLPHQWALGSFVKHVRYVSMLLKELVQQNGACIEFPTPRHPKTEDIKESCLQKDHEHIYNDMNMSPKNLQLLEISYMFCRCKQAIIENDTEATNASFLTNLRANDATEDH